MNSHRKAYAAGLVAAMLALGSALSGCSDSAGTSDPAPPRTTASVRTTATYTASRQDSAQPSDADLRTTADRLRERAAALGLRGTEVKAAGRTITVVAPGSSASQLRQMAATALLEFRPVLDPATAGQHGLREAYDAMTCGSTTTPALSRPERPTVACDRKLGQKYLLAPTAIGGGEVREATSKFDTNGNGWLVDLTFTAAGSRAFADVTGELAQRTTPANQFAIVLDGDVISAPAVMAAITGGEAQISGSYTQSSARSLAALVTSGALPVELTVVDVTTQS